MRARRACTGLDPLVEGMAMVEPFRSARMLLDTTIAAAAGGEPQTVTSARAAECCHVGRDTTRTLAQQSWEHARLVAHRDVRWLPRRRPIASGQCRPACRIRLARDQLVPVPHRPGTHVCDTSQGAWRPHGMVPPPQQYPATCLVLPSASLGHHIPDRMAGFGIRRDLLD